ncbi:dihydrolipoamide acetyltransferase family protein [Salinibacterium sp. G-O1]|uniref:dihydrolipoamide acetyltransferase family protein n=1 Tax=Salinibacterium sp. G-O1 TaxID=3046208 RepID=UPI0024BB29DF|nr:dihydrolipoamide acetyltransferase family protein [Salinibacterium sp. G-O1]MDJ0336323.1 dihydrolipoamide acetyltransferase family protein [Salinibacterium sp. G-O1]
MGVNVFRLPDLGEGLTEAALVRWIVEVGDTVAVDQAIAEVETAKSIVEVPSPYAGTVSARHGEEGEVLAVGAPLLEVDDGATGSGNVLIGYGTKERQASGRTRRRANGAALVPAAASAEPMSASSGPVAVRSPIVRRLARSSGVDLLTIEPTAPDGVIRRSDVLKAAADTTGPPESAPAELQVVRREPMGMLRKAVSERLTRSRTEIPEATIWVDVDATALWELRQAMGDSRPSFTAIISKFVLIALGEYPVLAGRLSADGSEIVEFDGVNLGVAVNTPRGLMVPVLRHAERDSIAALDTGIRRLADDAREGRLAPAELSGSTFTLNNYGGFGVDGSAGIINYPEVAMLGVGRMIERPWVVGGAIVPRRIVQLAMVFDHRVCDGGYAAGFLRSVVDAMESPASLFSRI